MDLGNVLRRELDPALLDVRVEALVAEADAENVARLVNAIVEVERHDNLADDDIQSWAEATAGHDGGSDPVAVKVQLTVWASLRELDRRGDVGEVAVLVVRQHKRSR